MMCTLERKISAAQTRAWRAVPGIVDAQTFASLLSLISTLSQIPVWMHFISIPLLMAIWRAQEQWMSDTEYFCYYSLSVKGTKQLLHISLTKSCVSNCPCWFHYTNEPLTSPRKPLPCVGFIQQDSLVYQQLRGNLGFISMLVMLNLFPIFYQKCHPSAKMQTWTWTNLAGADSAVDKGSAGSRHWTIHIIPAQKAVSTLRSFLLSCRLLLTKLAEVMMNLVWFGLVFQCQVMRTLRETGESPAIENLLWWQDECPMCSITHSFFFGKTHVTVLCLVALLYNREDLNCLSGHVDFLSPYKTAQCNNRLYFLKQILNTMCLLKIRIWYEFLLDIITALKG